MAVDRVICLKFPVFYKIHVQLSTAKVGISRISAMCVCFCSGSVDSSFANQMSFFISNLFGQGVAFLVILISNIIFSIALLSRRRKKDEENAEAASASQENSVNSRTLSCIKKSAATFECSFF